MALTGFGDLAQSFQSLRSAARFRTDAARLTVELTTGRVADPVRHLAGDLGPMAGLERSLGTLAAFRTAAAEAGQFAETVQTVLDRLQRLGTDAAPVLLAAGSTAAGAFVDASGVQARDAFEVALSALGTRYADRAVFAGQATAGPVVADPGTILAALLPVVAGETTADGVADAVRAWFDAPAAGFGDTGYLGSATPLAPYRVAPGEAVALGVTANDPAIRATLAALATGALLAEGVLAGAPEERAELARRAGEGLMSADIGLAHLRGQVGTAEARIAAAETRVSAERAAMEMRRTGLLGADPYETATRLQETQSRLEMLFTVTARLSRLNLSDFLR